MKTVIISPYSKKLKNGLPNPKNYPFWKDVVVGLQKENIYVIQVTTDLDESIGANEIKYNLQMSELRDLLFMTDTWISVDNFFHHFAAYYKKAGIVIFSLSDPNIFSHSININLLKDRKYLRVDQFNIWEQAIYNPDAYVESQVVVQSILNQLKRPAL